jgi:hypothetical protein
MKKNSVILPEKHSSFLIGSFSGDSHLTPALRIAAFHAIEKTHAPEYFLFDHHPRQLVFNFRRVGQ